MEGDSSSRAVSETAKATGKAIDAVSGLGRFFERVLGEPIEQAGGILGDAVRWKRANLEAIRTGVDARLIHRSLADHDLQPLPMKAGLAYIEGAAQEDDPRLQEMWQNLIANALDPNHEHNPKKYFASILTELEPIDAQVLKILQAEYSRPNVYAIPSGLNLNSISIAVTLYEDDVKLTLENLFRLSLISDVRPETIDGLNATESGLRVNDENANFHLTRLGLELVKACN